MSNKTLIGIDKSVERRSRGPTRHQIDENIIFNLAKIGMSQQHISDYCGISLSTFISNQDWIDIFNEGKGDFAKSIIEKQYNIAMDDSHKQQATMLLHIGKVQLKQKETQDVEIKAIENTGYSIEIIPKKNEESNPIT
jgi:hypothetical protein